jgi:predicted nuclease with TOPRIM domain
LQLNQAAILTLTAQAADAIAHANALRADVSDLMAQIDALNALVAQIEALESNRTQREGELVSLTAELEALPALRAQITTQRDAAAQAAQSLRETIRQMEDALAMIREINDRIAAAEVEMAQQRQVVLTEEAEALRTYESVASQRARVPELLPIESHYQGFQSDLNYILVQIRKLNLRIQAHRANEPRNPAPDRSLDDEGESRAMAPGRPLPGPGRPLPGTERPLPMPNPDPAPPIPPEQDWYEWKRILDQLEADLGQQQHREAAAIAAMQELEPYIQELTRIRSEIADADLRVQHHRSRADAARTLAAEAELEIIKGRERIQEIEHRTADLPILRVELTQRDAEVQGLNAQLEALPAHQAQLESQRDAAEAEIVTFTAQIAALTPQVAELPALIEAVGPTYIEIQALEVQATTATTQAAAATERVQSITVEIADLQTQLAPLPVVQSAVDSHRAALTALTATLTAKVNQHHSQTNAREVAQGDLMHLQQERTMSRSQLVLLIRGDLLRRFMRARIYAVEANGDAPGSNVMQPIFRQTVGTDITLLGFSLTGAQARGTNGQGGWYFVIEEPPTDVRFGLDEGEGVHRPVDAVTTWANVTWEDTVNDANALTAMTYLSVSGRLATESKPLTGDANAIAVEWGRNSAHLALITRQQPVRMVLHASTWLT